MNLTKKISLVFAVFLTILYPFALLIWTRGHESTGYSSIELIAYPLLFGTIGILLILVLKRLFLRENLVEFSLHSGNWYSDLGWGVLLTGLYFLLFFLERATLSEVLEFTPNTELLGLMLDMREKPLLILLWFGPVLWIGVALYEELIRVFLLSSLWKFSNQIWWILLVILISAVVFGIGHWSQGPYGMVTIGIKSIVSGIFYYYKRRLMPLIYAHALYDGLQVGMLLITYP